MQCALFKIGVGPLLKQLTISADKSVQDNEEKLLLIDAKARFGEVQGYTGYSIARIHDNQDIDRAGRGSHKGYTHICRVGLVLQESKLLQDISVDILLSMLEGVHPIIVSTYGTICDMKTYRIEIPFCLCLDD